MLFSATGRIEESTSCAPDTLTSYLKALRFLLISLGLVFATSLLLIWKKQGWIIIRGLCQTNEFASSFSYLKLKEAEEFPMCWIWWTYQALSSLQKGDTYHHNPFSVSFVCLFCHGDNHIQREQWLVLGELSNLMDLCPHHYLSVHQIPEPLTCHIRAAGKEWWCRFTLLHSTPWSSVLKITTILGIKILLFLA